MRVASWKINVYCHAFEKIVSVAGSDEITQSKNLQINFITKQNPNKFK